MALYYELPVFKDVYKMTLRIFELTAPFCREYEFTLGQDLNRGCILPVRNICGANKCGLSYTVRMPEPAVSRYCRSMLPSTSLK